MDKGWIGVDFDGTLAYYDEWRGSKHAGAPIAPMVERVRRWLAEGQKVKIFSTRGNDAIGTATVKRWLREQGLPELEVTATKDYFMIDLWDDRCVRVEANTGRILSVDGEGAAVG